MSKYEEKRDKFKDAVQRLEEAIADYDKLPNSTVRDGVIQRFEFCTELAWKTCREYLLEQGYTCTMTQRPPRSLRTSKAPIFINSRHWPGSWSKSQQNKKSPTLRQQDRADKQDCVIQYPPNTGYCITALLKNQAGHIR